MGHALNRPKLRPSSSAARPKPAGSQPSFTPRTWPQLSDASLSRSRMVELFLGKSAE